MRVSGVVPSSTSGAVNAGEPVITPVAVWKPPAILAIPKSVSSRFAVLGQQDVARFDVTMQDARPMGGLERPGQLHADAQRLTPIQRPVLADQRFE